MRCFTNKKITTIILVVVILFNFILPTVSNANKTVDKIAQGLFLAVAKLLRSVGDYFIEGLQEAFIGYEDKEIKVGDEYKIKYSPGVIFSGKVPALDINFFNPGVYYNKYIKEQKAYAYSYDYDSVVEKAIPAILEEFNYKKTDSTYTETVDQILDDIQYKYDKINTTVLADMGEISEYKIKGVTYQLKETNAGTYVFQFYRKDEATKFDDEKSIFIIYTVYESGGDSSGNRLKDAKQLFRTELIEKLGLVENNKEAENAEKELKALFDEKKATFSSGQTVSFDFRGTTIFINFEGARGVNGDANWNVYTETVYYEKETAAAKESSAETLQPIVATWYKTLRAIALVGLLSVLVYIGIRILISSTGQEKAKYKKMIGNWLAAICLLFILQYIMIFILEISDAITKILSKNILEPDGTDKIISTIRTKIDGGDDIFTTAFPELVIYIVLVVHTIIFTIKYLKRLLYMTFFTIIAPLITLTYPLDKVKDGQAQAFTMWLREYIFNALLQPMHLLLYYIFVTTASSLVGENWIFSIVAIGFLVPAEKFFRKMFGFDKAEASGQLGAAAAGALAMNAINSLKKIGKSTSTKNSEESQNSEQKSEGGNSKATPRYIKAPERKNSSSSTLPMNLGVRKNENPKIVFGQKVEKKKPKVQMNLKNGAKTLLGHYNPANKANAGKILKGTGRLARKAIVGAAGAATLGTVGLAIGTATGDASKAFGYAGAGLGVGYVAANNLGDRAAAFEKKNRELYKKGSLGTDEYKKIKSIKELTKDNDFNRSCKYLEIEDPDVKEELIRQFHENGIDDLDEIKKVMTARVRTGVSQEEAIAAYKIKKQAEKEGLRRDNIEKRLKKLGIQGKKLEDIMETIDML